MLLWKFTSAFILSTFKFFMALPYTRAIGLPYLFALLATVGGGILGLFVFYYLSSWLILAFRDISFTLQKRGIINRKLKEKRIFSTRTRRIVKTKQSYGLWGITLLTPVLLSIPVGAFLLRKYYPHSRHALPLQIFFIAFWAFMMLSIYFFVPTLI